ncbi:MAG: hypothetical protein AABW99_04315, partial [archaeon]
MRNLSLQLRKERAAGNAASTSALNLQTQVNRLNSQIQGLNELLQKSEERLKLTVNELTNRRAGRQNSRDESAKKLIQERLLARRELDLLRPKLNQLDDAYKQLFKENGDAKRQLEAQRRTERELRAQLEKVVSTAAHEQLEARLEQLQGESNVLANQIRIQATQMGPLETQLGQTRELLHRAQTDLQARTQELESANRSFAAKSAESKRASKKIRGLGIELEKARKSRGEISRVASGKRAGLKQARRGIRRVLKLNEGLSQRTALAEQRLGGARTLAESGVKELRQQKAAQETRNQLQREAAARVPPELRGGTTRAPQNPPAPETTALTRPEQRRTVLQRLTDIENRAG